MSEKEEYAEILQRARKLSKDQKISLSEALLLIAAHELLCIHFHVDSGFILGAIKRAEGSRKE